MARKKIVFLIDVNPVVCFSCPVTFEDYCEQIQFATFRILDNFAGRHKWCGEDESYSPLWGFKFYDSSGGQPDYGSHNFYDLRIDEVYPLEEELKTKVPARFKSNTNKTELLKPVSHQLSCALAEIVSQFQWDRPEFLSPLKSKKSQPRYNEKKSDIFCINEKTKSNFVFIFTPCPSCCGEVKYFETGRLSSADEIKEALIKTELFEEIVNVKSISLYWVDTGFRCNKMKDSFHVLLSEALKYFGGSLLSCKVLSSWWITNCTQPGRKFLQPVPFSSLMDFLLLDSECGQKKSRKPNISSTKDYHILLYLKDIHCPKNNTTICRNIPLKLRPATANNKEIMKVSNLEHERSISDFRSSSTFLAQPLMKITDRKMQDRRKPASIANIKFVAKINDSLLMLQDMQQSYFCSFSHDDMNEKHKKDPSLPLAFQQLLRILLGKKLILFIEVQDSESGFKTDACLYPLTNACATVTFLSISGDSLKNVCLKTFSVGQLLKELSLMTSMLSMQQTTLSKKTSTSDIREVYLPENHKIYGKQLQLSFVQSLEYWFYDVPVQSFSLNFHQDIKRLQALVKNNGEDASRESSLLLSKLKDCYKSSNSCAAKKAVLKAKHGLLRSQSKSATYSQKLIAKSKAVKAKQISDEAMKEKEVNTKQSFEKSTQSLQENDVEYMQEENLANMKEICFLNVEEMSAHLKKVINSVLEKDAESYEKFSNSISTTLVDSLTKLDEKRNAQELLDQIFDEMHDLDHGTKAAKVARTLLHVLMHLDIAVLLKSATLDSDAVAAKAVILFRRLIFLETPSYLAKYLNNVILPKYKSTILKIILGIYEGLAQEPPNELLTPSKIESADENVFESSDVESVLDSDMDSNRYLNQSYHRLKRFASTGDSMPSKRQIIVPMKKNKKDKKNKKSSSVLTTSWNETGKEGWCRNLFESDTNSVTNKGSRKRKLQGRHSEIASSVKDTPVVKQRRHSIWKRQHGERKKTEGITNKTVIEESPMKNLKESPVTLKGSSRLLFSSQSFCSKSSPRKFYSFKRNKSCLTSNRSTSRNLFSRTASCSESCYKNLTEKEDIDVFAQNISASDKTVLPSNDLLKVNMYTQGDNQQTYPEHEFLNNSLTPGETNGKLLNQSIVPEKYRIFEKIGDNDKKGDQEYNASSKKLETVSLLSFPQSRNLPNKFEGTPKPGLGSVDVTCKTVYDVGNRPKVIHPLLFSEDSMDWVRMFEKDKADQIPQELQNSQSSPLQPTAQAYSAISERESKASTSPSHFPPSQDDKQLFSSPFLSVSSLEVLENAPIISPGLEKSKKKRNSSCRKRINVPSE